MPARSTSSIGSHRCSTTGKGQIDVALQKAPENYRKLVRLGAYGSFINYYICGISFRATTTDGTDQTVVFPWIEQDTGRCAEP